MSIWKHTFRGVFILGNLIVGTGFLCCAYSPLVSPVAHPVLALSLIHISEPTRRS